MYVCMHLVYVHLSSPCERTVVVPTEHKDGVVVRVTVARIQSSHQFALISVGSGEGKVQQLHRHLVRLPREGYTGMTL